MVRLVEARLSEAGKVSLVERQQIDKVLQEQKLQAVLGADAIAGRIAMGKLLQADLLYLSSRKKSFSRALTWSFPRLIRDCDLSARRCRARIQKATPSSCSS